MKAKFKFLTTLTLLLLGGVTQLQASVPEPSTLIYGEVLHRAYGSEHQLTEGTLVWTLRDESGVEFTYTTELEDIKGVYSYKIEIPHQALSSGLSVDSSIIPLGVGESTYEFVSIEVDGYPAAILWSEVDLLKLLQNSRAATHRVDLLVSFDMQDTDGDGMPDWWEQFYGLDWQNPDAGLDTDGDGWSNLDEYMRGSNPLIDDRSPSIQTLNLFAYGESDNGVWLRALDSNSSADELVFTLTSLPEGGYIHFTQSAEGSAAPETVLSVGATFTQTQLNLGLVAYRHTDPAITETSFKVTVGDGGTTSDEAEVVIDVFPPSPLLVLEDSTDAVPFWWREENVIFEAYWSLREDVISGDLVESALLYLLGKDYGWTLWDQRAQTLPVTLETAAAGSHFILGGSANDVLIGSSQGDILSGGTGFDTLTGGAGTDLFIVGDEGLEVITDFNVAEDVLDLSDLLVEQSGRLDEFVSVSYDGSATTIGVDRDGDGSGFTDASIRLEGVELSHDDLHRLWSQGQLLVAELLGHASVSIEGWPADALEEGYSTADLIVRRNGPNDQPLTVDLAISGSATNGVDYHSIPTSVSFAANESTATVSIDPILDSLSEYIEQLSLEVIAGADYVLGSNVSGVVAIADAKQRFGIRLRDEYAVVGEGTKRFEIYRVGPRDGNVNLFLSFGGTAVSGLDYSAIDDVVAFAANDNTQLINVTALPNGALGAGETSRTLTVSLSPPTEFDGFELAEATDATMRLLSSMVAFDAWVAEVVPEVGALTSEEQQVAESPRTGLQALLEYALSYGLDLEDGVDAREHAQLSPQLIQAEDGMHVEFTKRLNDPSISYIVECSGDMSSWHHGTDYFEAIELPETEENAGRVRYRVVGSDEGGSCFIRVRVVLSE